MTTEWKFTEKKRNQSWRVADYDTMSLSTHFDDLKSWRNVSSDGFCGNHGMSRCSKTQSLRVTTGHISAFVGHFESLAGTWDNEKNAKNESAIMKQKKLIKMAQVWCATPKKWRYNGDQWNPYSTFQLVVVDFDEGRCIWQTSLRMSSVGNCKIIDTHVQSCYILIDYIIR